MDIAQVEAGAAMVAPLYLEPLATGEDVLPAPNHVPGSVLSGVFASAGEDSWVAVELETPADWNAATEVLGVPQLAVDGTWPSDEAVEQLTKVLATWAEERSHEQAARSAAGRRPRGRPVTRRPTSGPTGSLWARERITRKVHPDLGPLHFVQPFQRLVSPVPAVRWAAARLGEHHEQVLSEWLGETSSSGEA